jgi:hypothetical protein
MKSSNVSDSDSSSTSTINIVVGSENPVKVNAATSGAEKVFGIEKRINCVGFEVGSLRIYVQYGYICAYISMHVY